MSKFFIMMSVVFAMAFGMVGNASASEDFVGVFAHDITGGLVDKDFLETDNVLENKDIGILGKSGILPFVVAHDIVKGGAFTVFGAIGGTVYGSAIVTNFAVDGFAVATDSTSDGFGGIADSTAEGFGGIVDSTAKGFGVIIDSTADGFGVIADSIKQIFNIF